jgi:hypothetical protein
LLISPAQKMPSLSAKKLAMSWRGLVNFIFDLNSAIEIGNFKSLTLVVFPKAKV